ncbi:LamB/YcsF family protein [Melissospora conviva]|uniref:LamB/YcsF family protein n=1 Tax=Melissospora conviva TaxID=3388432 RepID=UPI003C1ACAA2
MDLNADVGESFGLWRLGDDDELLDLITSANVACGFHAGDAMTMRQVCTASAARGVAVGALVGYRDLAGFGRRRIEYDFAELRDEVLYQIGALEAFCRVTGVRLNHVKPYGALYRTAAVDEVQAAAVVAAISEYDPQLGVLCAPGSVLAQLATGAGLRPVAEGFVQRAYLPTGQLVARESPGAVITDPEEVARRAVRMAAEHQVVAIDGTVVPCPVESLCLQSDIPGTVRVATLVRAALTDAGLTPVAFV